MKQILLSVLVGLMSLSSIGFAGDWTETLKKYECLEVRKFTVDREDLSTKKSKRAATIPDEALDHLQQKITEEISRKKLVPEVSGDECTGVTLVFGGRVTDFKKGSRSARFWIGLGAGQQKFEVQCFLRDKATGEILLTKEIIDRKVGGWAGGDDAKGESDFAEKVAKFIRKGK